jgi:micrococcal nuclease
VVIYPSLAQDTNPNQEQKTALSNSIETVTLSKGELRGLKPSPFAIKVERVLSSVSFLGEDKKIYRLAGLTPTPFSDASQDLETPSDMEQAARDALEKLILGQELILWQPTRSTQTLVNRNDEILGHFVRKKDQAWVQGSLLISGLGVVRTTPNQISLAEKMLSLENEARANKRGHWTRSFVLSDNQALSKVNSFQIVEGKIRSVGQRHNQSFLNFGANYKHDFTVQISTHMRKKLARDGIDTAKLGGATVRVRGWIEPENGALIRLDHPEQMEVLQLGSLEEQNSSGFKMLKPQKDAKTEIIDENPYRAGLRSILAPEEKSNEPSDGSDIAEPQAPDVPAPEAPKMPKE